MRGPSTILILLCSTAFLSSPAAAWEARVSVHLTTPSDLATAPRVLLVYPDPHEHDLVADTAGGVYTIRPRHPQTLKPDWIRLKVIATGVKSMVKTVGRPLRWERLDNMEVAQEELRGTLEPDNVPRLVNVLPGIDPSTRTAIFDLTISNPTPNVLAVTRLAMRARTLSGACFSGIRRFKVRFNFAAGIAEVTSDDRTTRVAMGRKAEGVAFHNCDDDVRVQFDTNVRAAANDLTTIRLRVEGASKDDEDLLRTLGVWRFSSTVQVPGGSIDLIAGACSPVLLESLESAGKQRRPPECQ